MNLRLTKEVMQLADVLVSCFNIKLRKKINYQDRLTPTFFQILINTNIEEVLDTHHFVIHILNVVIKN